MFLAIFITFIVNTLVLLSAYSIHIHKHSEAEAKEDARIFEEANHLSEDIDEIHAFNEKSLDLERICYTPNLALEARYQAQINNAQITETLRRIKNIKAAKLESLTCSTALQVYWPKNIAVEYSNSELQSGYAIYFINENKTTFWTYKF